MNGWHGGLINNISGDILFISDDVKDCMFLEMDGTSGKLCLYTVFAMVLMSIAATISYGIPLSARRDVKTLRKFIKNYVVGEAELIQLVSLHVPLHA